MRDAGYLHHIRVDWGHPGSTTVDDWDEIAIWVIDQFGLPGGEYITDLSPDYMTWSFRDRRNAFLMRLRFAEVIVEGELA